MEENAKVSIMFLSYNHGAYIKRALDSVVNQTYQNFEIILSDDCSQDNTKEVLQEIRNDKLKIHFFEQNQGATINFEYIWKQCTGQYLALINSDDEWLPAHLEKSVAYLENHEECGAVFSWADMIDEDENPVDPNWKIFRQPNRTQAGWIKHLFMEGNCLCHPSIVIRREVYEKAGFYKLGFRQLPDYNMWTRLLNHYSLHIIEEVLVLHRRFLKTGQNTSAPLTVNSIRDVNESLYTLLHYFDSMPDELFKEAFREEFRNRSASTREELLCEKFFLMYDGKYYMKPISKVAAFFYLHDIYDLKGVRELLRDKYNFSLNAVHELGTHMDFLGLRTAGDESLHITEKNKPSVFHRLRRKR